LSEVEQEVRDIGTDYGREFTAILGLIDTRLELLFPPPQSGAQRLHQSIRYSLLDGGKRLRPLVTMLTTRALGGDTDCALDPACAVEMVHTASLMLDDLPCMDDASQRRGKSANHIAYGQDIAILGSVSLISEAFGVIARSNLTAPLKAGIVELLSDSIGVHGLAAGQEHDLRDIALNPGQDALEQMQQQKTGALYKACMEIGARIAGLNDDDLRPFTEFGKNVGLAFQIFDDLLDAAGDPHRTGKDHLQDLGKPTFASIMDTEQAEAQALELFDSAISGLRPLGKVCDPFVAFLELILDAYHDQVDRTLLLAAR